MLSKTLTNSLQQLNKTYNKLSIWGKLLLFVILFLIILTYFKSNKKLHMEGFEQSDKFLIKSDNEIYDEFYSNIYDDLVYSNIKTTYEIGEILNNTEPSEQSIILDVGCGTGHHVAELASKDLNVIGIDKSVAMIQKAKEYYPNYDFKVGDVLNAGEFSPNSFTHILCLYFTIYYMKDKMTFFNNCMSWLKPGGYLVIHLVDREMFDPILPPGNPLLMVSPQKYAKNRITSTNVTFDDFKYNSNFDLDDKNDIATFSEKFKFNKSNKVRKNEHKMYMPSEDSIIQMAQEVGFNVQGKIDLIKATYEYQYLYILVKPN